MSFFCEQGASGMGAGSRLATANIRVNVKILVRKRVYAGGVRAKAQFS